MQLKMIIIKDTPNLPSRPKNKIVLYPYLEASYVLLS